MEISKDQIEQLAKLSKLALDPEKEAALIKDFNGIFAHFEELKELPAQKQSQLVSTQKHELRSDDEDIQPRIENQDELIGQFPKEYGGNLEAPHVFKKEEK